MKFTIHFNNVGENCIVYINDVPIEDGIEVDVPYSFEGYFIKIVANDGYVFDELQDGSLVYYDEWGNPTYISIKYVDTEYWSENYTIFERDMEVPEYDGWGNPLEELEATLYDITPIEGGSSIEPVDLANIFAGLYNLTVDELEELSGEYHTLISYGEGEPTIVIHASEFISELYILPFNAELDVTPDTVPIQMGGKTLTTEAKKLTTSIMKVEIGSIPIPAEYNNVYDYINTTCYIHLPFTTKKELDVARVIGKTITVDYNIDLYIGMSTCNIRADEELLESFQLNLAREIPFRTKREEPNIVGSPEGILINNIETPYIELVRNIPYNEVGEFGNNVQVFEKIGNLEGYIEIDKMELNSNATRLEREEIFRLLSSGVFINP